MSAPRRPFLDPPMVLTIAVTSAGLAGFAAGLLVCEADHISAARIAQGIVLGVGFVVVSWLSVHVLVRDHLRPGP